MSYGKVLLEMIKKNNISFKELALKCKENGKSIDPSYISKLVNGKITAPSDEISKIIAKVLKENEQNLIIEADLEKTPTMILEFIKKIKLSSMLPVLEKMKGTVSKEQLEDFKEYLTNQPLSDFILEIINSDFNIQQTKGRKMVLEANSSNVNISLSQPIGLPINDNSMEPTIPEGSTVSFLTGINYRSGDIIGYIPEDNHEIRLRKYYRKNDMVILVPENKEYEPVICRKENITIVGKVDKVVVKL